MGMKYWYAIIIFMMIGLGITSDVAGSPPEPEGWIYGETSVSGLPPEEKARLCGVAEGLELPKTIRHYTQYSYPANLDWREYGGNYTTRVKDQGWCGSCVAFAVTASIESRMKIQFQNPSADIDLSESHVFHCGCGTCCDKGWWNYEALDYIVANGLCDESCSPYVDSDIPCELCSNWQERIARLAYWVGVEGQDEMKQAIAEGGPISVVMTVHNDFFWYKGGIYCPTVPWMAGLHAVEVVGYNDDEGYWIVKNSWGTGWGEEGWFRIGYDCGVWPYGYVPFMAELSVPGNKIYLPFLFKNL